MNFSNVNDVTIHYKFIPSATSLGRKRCFVFINSLGTDFRIWDEVAEMIKIHGDVLLFDNRGHGLSELVLNTNGLDDFTNDLVALLEKLSIRKCIPVGLSVGGMIAMLLAHRNPEIVEKLVLCDTRHIIGNAQVWNDRIGAVREGGISAIVDGVMQRWFPENFRKDESIKVTGCRNMLERTPPTGYILTCEAIRDANLTEVARSIKLPTICLVGSEDKSTLPEEVKNLSELIEGSTYKIIQGSGHIPCIDNPKELSRLILDFVSQ